MSAKRGAWNKKVLEHTHTHIIFLLLTFLSYRAILPVL